MEWIFSPDKCFKLRYWRRSREKCSMVSILLLPSSMKNLVVLCGTNNIPKDTSLRYIADWIVNLGSIFWNKFSGINVSVCGLILRERWPGNMVLINEMNEILKYQCNINGFKFIFQYPEQTLPYNSLDCTLSYKDLLHLME